MSCHHSFNILEFYAKTSAAQRKHDDIDLSPSYLGLNGSMGLHEASHVQSLATYERNEINFYGSSILGPDGHLQNPCAIEVSWCGNIEMASPPAFSFFLAKHSREVSGTVGIVKR